MLNELDPDEGGGVGEREGVDEGGDVRDVREGLGVDVIVEPVRERGGGEEESELGFVGEEDRVVKGGLEDDTLELDGEMVGLELEDWDDEEPLKELVFEVDEDEDVEPEELDEDIELEEMVEDLDLEELLKDLELDELIEDIEVEELDEDVELEELDEDVELKELDEDLGLEELVEDVELEELVKDVELEELVKDVGFELVEDVELEEVGKDVEVSGGPL